MGDGRADGNRARGAPVATTPWPSRTGGDTSAPMTGTLTELTLAAAVFVASHVLISGTRWRGRLVGMTGEKPFQAAFSVLSLLLIWWLIQAYRGAPHVGLWETGTAVRHGAMAVMLVASILVAAGFSLSSPTGVGSGGGLKAPAGIIKVTRHPVMWGVGLWALIHMAANGDAAGVILFGSMAVLAFAGALSIDSKKRRLMPAEWTRFADETSFVPFAAMISGRTRLSAREIAVWRLIAGVALFAGLSLAHEPVIGVSPFGL